jgi:DNA-binding transcriptional regulator PaaX
VPDDLADDDNATIDPGWLVLVYRIPSEPTRVRATVWRRLKALGAIYLQNSVAALPKSLGSERALRRLRHEILEMGGTAVLMNGSAIAGGATILETYQAARSDEYDEIVDRCRGFLAEVEKEYTKNHFTYAELEENEVDHTKLVTWLEKVRSRDEFGAPGGTEAQAALQRCTDALEEYAARVYAEEPEGH